MHEGSEGLYVTKEKVIGNGAVRELGEEVVFGE